MDSRDVQIARLLAFQDVELNGLTASLDDVDKELEKAETEVLRCAELVSAVRAIVQMRGGDVEKVKRAKRRQNVWATTKKEGLGHEEEMQKPHVKIGVCGVVYTRFSKRFEAPRQSFVGGAGNGVVVLTCGGLKKVVNGCRLWLVYWLDRNNGLWRHFVRPPRAKGGWRVGVFATRSPNRPSPIGLSLCVVEHVDVEGERLFVDGLDVLDETPLIAFRVYEEGDVFVGAKAGWVDEMERLRPLYYDVLEDYNGVGSISVKFGEQAEDKVQFIDQRSAIDVREMVVQSLKRLQVGDAKAHTACEPDGGMPGTLPVGSFRFLYTLWPQGLSVVVHDVVSGMRRTVCKQEATTDPEALLHLEFHDTFSDKR